MTLIDVVDENDNVIKVVEWNKKTKSDILRCAVVFLFNNNDEILLQLRSKKEKNYPLCWDLSAGGHLDSGEDYAEGAKREMFEEIGVKTKLEFIDKYLFEPGDGRRYFSSLFKGRFSGKFKIDANEVSEVEFFSLEKIRKMIKNNDKFHPECLFALKKYIL